MKFNAKILLIVLFLLSLVIITLILKQEEKTDKANTAVSKVKEENTTVKPVPKPLEPEKKEKPTKVISTQQDLKPKKQESPTLEELSKLSPLFRNDKTKTLDEDKLITTEPQLEIGQIMQEQKRINTFAQDKYSLEKKENWEVDYGMGLEDGALENLKNDPSLKPEMVNGKVEFSTSF